MRPRSVIRRVFIRKPSWSVAAPNVSQVYASSEAPWKMTLRALVLLFARGQQAMHMHNEIPHMGIVDCLLRFAFPCGKRCCIVRKDPDDVQFFQIPELNLSQIAQLTTEHQMQKLFLVACLGHLIFPIIILPQMSSA